MKKNLCLLLVGILPFSICVAKPSVKNLRCENRKNTLGIDLVNQRFNRQKAPDHLNTLLKASESAIGNKSAPFY
jgi:hypothetical protein